MDPPAWGVGANGEKWKLEDKLEELLKNASQLVENKGFLILNTYSPTIDLKSMERISNRIFKKRDFEVRELWMKTTSGKELFFGNLLRIHTK